MKDFGDFFNHLNTSLIFLLDIMREKSSSPISLLLINKKFSSEQTQTILLVSNLKSLLNWVGVGRGTLGQVTELKYRIGHWGSYQI